MHRRVLALSFLALTLGLGVAIHTGCKVKRDPTAPTFVNYYQTVVPEPTSTNTRCYVATGTPCSPTPTWTRTFTHTTTATTGFSSTFTATATLTRTATSTATATRTSTPAATATPTLSPTVTLSPTDTFTPTVTLSPTDTFTPTETRTPTDSPTETRTFTETDTPTQTPTPTDTVPPTATPTFSPTITPTACTPTANFGYTSVPANPNVITSAGEVWVAGYALGSAGTLSTISVYVSSPDGDDRIQVGVYSDDTGMPDSLIVQSSTVAISNGWNTVDVPDTALAAGTYWLAVAVDFATGNPFVNVPQDTSASTSVYTQTGTFGTMPSSYGTPAGGPVNYDLGIYADYCP